MMKSLRLNGVLFMGITVPVTLMGSVGITCVALNPTSYNSMKAIAPYQWLYILYVLICAALGVLGIRSTIEPQVLCEIWRAYTNSTNIR